ncbi:MAG: hypothetical protein E7101_14570 [Prevotella ruminicola]|jgi:hypothetical protein|uniref:Uncharacterized protein n=1 Tax=Xylanibacter ruminicola TaxID=839 RepID=A0A9D5SBK1_XYLRU|nr:hypothetical protein [Xylanibacter ruminicola]
MKGSMLVMEFENLCVIIIGHLVENPEPKDKWLPENVSYNEFGGRSTSGRLQPLPMFLSKHI